MADLVGDVETGQILLEGAIVVAVLYVIYKFANQLNSLSLAGSGINLMGPQPQVSGIAKGFADGSQLTPASARSIAVLAGVFPNYGLSTDSMQVWFYNGSYYDNRNGHVYSGDGTDQGAFFNSDGSINSTAQAVIQASSSSVPGSQSGPIVVDLPATS